MAPQREWFEKDYYATLGVSKDAAEKDITRAYRKLAKQYHPDANPGDTSAEDRFKEVSAAYDVLGDAAKRKEYDEVRALAGSGGFPNFGAGGTGGFGGFDFGEGGNVLDVVKVWEGGLGIWGAVALGAVGVWVGARRHGHSFLDLADAIVPGLLVAQALGRWGNWFNNELYGAPSDAPWAVTIHEWDAAAGRAVTDGSGEAVVLGTFQPTFLYESLWCLLVALVLVLVDRRVRFARGQVLALYVMGYTAGRLVIELMRTDPATIVLGQRINVWVSIGVFLLGAALYVAMGRRRDYPPRGPRVEPAADAGPQPARAG